MPALNPAELKATREHLGLSDKDLATALGISARAVRHWEEGKYAIPDNLCDEVRAIEAAADQFVAEHIKLLAAAETPTFATYRSDAEYPGNLPHRASWHRAAAARIARAVPGCRLAYVPDDVRLPDLDGDAWAQLADVLSGTYIDDSALADPRRFLIGEIEDLEDDATGQTACPGLLSEARNWTRGQAAGALAHVTRKDPTS